MALTKETVIDRIEVGEDSQLQIRTATRVMEDGVQLSSSFHRHVVAPRTKVGDTWEDTDISSEDARVQAICNASWTADVKTAYQNMINAQSD